MDMSPQEYQEYVKRKSPKSPLLKDVVLAFVIGGAICVVGQAVQSFCPMQATRYITRVTTDIFI